VSPDPSLLDQVRLHLPQYLSGDTARELAEQLEKFPNVSPFYVTTFSRLPEMLQGDGWRGFVAINFDTLEKKEVTGLVVSNSCSISPDNERAVPVNIVFAPILRLASYQERLRTETGWDTEKIDAVCDSIRRQTTYSVFHLPELDGLPESMVFFHDLHAHPAEDFLAKSRTRLFALTDVAFYAFLLKLSIYFTRMQERVERGGRSSEGGTSATVA
jgi:hypothetical protein